MGAAAGEVDRLLGVGLIVVDLEYHLIAQEFSGLVDVFDGKFDAGDRALSVGGSKAAEWSQYSHCDGVLSMRAHDRTGNQRQDG